jgi:hypothetical protein
VTAGHRHDGALIAAWSGGADSGMTGRLMGQEMLIE